MTVLVDTSVWSLAFRRDVDSAVPEVEFLRSLLESGEIVLTTGIVLQELLQGFSGPRAREQLIARFSVLPLLSPSRDDHIEAASLRNRCRKVGVQVGTIDALLAQLCIRHNIPLLTTDGDFAHIARLSHLRVWKRGSRR